MLKWMDAGVRPKGDAILNRKTVQPDTFGCRSRRRSTPPMTRRRVRQIEGTVAHSKYEMLSVSSAAVFARRFAVERRTFFCIGNVTVK